MLDANTTALTRAPEMYHGGTEETEKNREEKRQKPELDPSEHGYRSER
jgi:hypothetical protein